MPVAPNLLIRGLVLAALSAVAAVGHAETLYGLVGTSSASALVRFDSADPAGNVLVGPLTGLASGFTVRAIDVRPADGLLYAIGHNGSSTGQLYIVNTDTADCVAVGSGFSLFFSGGQISMDFNPVVDRIRVVDFAGDNLRVNPDTGATAGFDTGLSYAPGDVQTGSPSMVDIAYTHNANGATTTTVYGWDYVSDALVTIGLPDGAESPNAGQVHTVAIPPGAVTTGANVGFDVSGDTGIAYVSHDSAGGSTDVLETIDLATGARTPIGGFGTRRILDIAVTIDGIFANAFD